MAAHNMAADDADALSLHDMEAGLGSSRCHLLIPMEEERAPSIKQSISKSVRTSVRKMRYYCAFVTTPIKIILLKFKLLILIALYSVFGAWLFTTLEVPHDLAQKEEAYHGRLIARDVMILNLRAIHLDNREDREERWKEAVMKFEEDLGLEEPSLDTAWTFWMAFLYAGTLYTTIGYGNIACQTTAGKVATLLYAFVGIPIMLVLLNGLGDLLLKIVKNSAGTSSDLFLFLGVRWGFVALEEGSKKRRRYLAFCKKLSRLKLISATSVRSITHAEDDEDGDIKPDPPVFSAIIVTFGWIFLSAAVFCIWEDWTYFTSVYFFFISCSTIGLGDVTPDHPEYMIFAFGVVMVGLALVTVCINVVQDKLELMYMALLNKLLEDYMAAVESGDPNAAEGMMSGFQGRAKFLMPLISKNQGTKVMNQFKEDCAAKGIDPPPVLTSINPETGMPAFASANKEDFNDYIEQAEERQAEERKQADERVQSRTSNKQETRGYTVELIDTGTQVSEPPLYAPRSEGSSFGRQTARSGDRSFGAQYTPPSLDEECQTVDCESCDEGIQTWPSCEEVSVQYDAVILTDNSTQYDLQEPTKSSGVSAAIERSTTGIQPEVSMFSVPDDSEEDFSTDDLLSDEEEANEPIEEKVSNLALPSIPSIQRLRKSFSEESQDTVVSVSPSMSPNTRRKKLEEKKRKRKNLKMEGLRFMKNSGDQTTFEVFHTETQTESTLATTEVQCLPETAEQSVQYELERKGRRCQTRLTCIPAEKQCGIIRRLSSRSAQLPLRKQLSNISASSEPFNSASSFEALAQHHSLRSIDESEVLQMSEPEWAEDVSEEVVLNVSLVSRPVDEHGEYVQEKPHFTLFDQSIGDDDVTGAEIGDEVFDSDDELDDDEMEHFVINGWTQTEENLKDNCETQVSLTDLDIFRGVTCQTELSSFRIQETSIEKQTPVNEESSEDVAQQSDDIVKFLTDSGCQPEVISFGASTQTDVKLSTATVFTRPQTQDFSEQTEEKKTLNCLSQTEPSGTQVATQTELITRDVDAETEKREQREEETQVTIDTTEIGVHVASTLLDSDSQTEEKWRCEENIQVQTEPTLCETSTETENDIEEKEAQTSVLTNTTSSQWDLEKHDEFSQTEMDTADFTSQANWKGVDNETQTEEIIKKPKRKESTKIQTSSQSTSKETSAAAVVEHCVSAVDATFPMTSTQAQSDVSMFVVDQNDRSRLEVVHDVRFNVDSATWMEEKRQKSVGTQKEPTVDNISIQVTPNLTTSQTQYVFACATDQTSQTEISTKNKRSQGMDAVAPTENSGCSTEWSKTEMAVQEPPPTVLWSDFDPILEEWEEDEEGQFEIQDEHSVSRTDAECTAVPETEETEIQAVVETATKGSGMESGEDWVKVYVQELDEERRNRMLDIGIQTGVLARVQHMYGKKDVPVVEGDAANVDILKVSLRKTESTETINRKKNEGSDESLSHASSVRSIAESVADSIAESVEEHTTTWPTTSKAHTEVRRSASVRKPRKKEAAKGEVADAIRRFEKRSGGDPKRQRSSSSER